MRQLIRKKRSNGRILADGHRSQGTGNTASNIGHVQQNHNNVYSFSSITLSGFRRPFFASAPNQTSSINNTTLIHHIFNHTSPSPDISVSRLVPIPESPTTRDTRESCPTSAKDNLMLRIEEVAYNQFTSRVLKYRNSRDKPLRHSILHVYQK